ncbi:MAG: DEAD/DEAH box helicase family protein [Ignavibacteriae bacterium]|nr:DEAD/DEAH box helicase family protein [Ignavibacteriota bacterium]MCB9216205.1 DEAD/DEAH box helicase family protein [Ignavibacteria bacterium]
MSASLFDATPKTEQTNVPPKPTTRPASLPGITLSSNFRFRRGQAIFLSKLAEAFRRGEQYHLGVFVPGYGKTITALSSFVIAHALGVAKKLVIFVPRGNLREQYADKKELATLFKNLGGHHFSFAVADSERVFLKNIETQIIITTYQYASGKGGASALRQYCASAPTMFIFDEVHHLADDGTWASVIASFSCACSVALSGTPMRSDNKSLFGVPMEGVEGGEQYYKALHEVTLKEAHAEGKILKKVEAHVVDYHLTMIREDTGEMVEMTLSELAEIAVEKQDVDAFLARRKLRFHEVYLETLLKPAFERFAEKRAALEEWWEGSKEKGERRNHQMLVIAMSNRHAAAMLDFIRRRFPNFSSARIGQDIPAKERKTLLEKYRDGKIDVMVQVDMIGEGTDIKPISVIVKADLVRAWSKTLQQIFRGMRYYNSFPEEANLCDIYSADDSQVVATLTWITSEQRFGLRMQEKWQEERNVLKGEPKQSLWDLAAVQHADSQTHILELFPEYATRGGGSGGGDQLSNIDDYILDVGKAEEKLRSDCAAMAAKLSFMLEARGEKVEPRDIHSEAMRRFAKSQGRLSIEELKKKKSWLERCITMRKLI